MNDLREKLLPTASRSRPSDNSESSRSKNRLTLMYEKGKHEQDSSFEFQDWQGDHKMYHSIIEDHNFAWNSEQIMERTLIMEQPSEQQLKQPNQQGEAKLTSITSQSKSNLNSNLKMSKQIIVEPPKKKELNNRIFNMKLGPQTCLYYFNILFNLMFRVGLIMLLVYLLYIGDGDQNQQEEQVFLFILLGLQGIISLLYFLAITKMLYTKSSDISVYFQKQFYEKPYAQIHMERILRKHFTAKKIISNLCRLVNPRTKFSKDIRIAVMRQQIYKRMELIIVFLPLAIVFIMGMPWFDRSNNSNATSFDVRLLMAIVVSLQTARTIFHYLFIYIFS